MEKKFSLIANNYPSFVDRVLKNCETWLECKRNDDNAEGLWRIHNKLYDVTDFIEKHPGGTDWLTLTRGTDITEAFEVHHINTKRVEGVLKDFYIKEASTPRNIKLTFNDDGFYRTLKRRVAEKLPTISKRAASISNLTIDSLLFLTFLTAILAARYQSLIFAFMSGIILAMTVVASHNYFHRRDNFRMFYFNLSFMSYREWRVSHALSHHLYANSLQDMEVMLLEPFLVWLPKNKGFIQRYVSWIYGPILWSLLFFAETLKRIAGYIIMDDIVLYKADLIPLALPISMYVFGSCGELGYTLKLWATIILISSFYFSLVGINAGHHHPDVMHDGDALRDDLDWGIFTLDTNIDREDTKVSNLLVLTHFGQHALHHLFPTLDHGILSELNPILYETIKEFDLELRSRYWPTLIAGQHLQLARTEPLSADRFKKTIKYDFVNTE